MLTLRLIVLVAFLLLLSQLVIAQDVLRSVRAQNAAGDLRGENWRVRNFIMWPAQEGAKTYVVYRATSTHAPWLQLAQVTSKDVIDPGYEDVTNLAETNDLCYRIEAVNEVRQLIRVYEAVCIPKYNNW